MIQEFKEFINKGNVVEMAVAFVMGLAFKPVIDAIVYRVLMPLIAMIFGQPNFDQIGTFACAGEGGTVVTGNGIEVACAGSVGAVITTLVNFALIAFALFLVVRAYNGMKRAQEEAEEAAAGPSEVELLTEIRDQLARP